ncbi:alpha/beta hydrolase [Priestia flexa]|jgi:phospholipase/carboxylesterase|uniref:Alpha/beta hydrolase n=1 Tax=Priestia flexa TaxID=86664 RepID=A0A8I1MHB0_9BACI|nr:alpha/beta hydrolase [Priestia flexa]MBN8252331.1 alpha/beta hydrolase [Priestia flexa]MBN8435840.1 alpha/beta hydrolase [Priestia flexa]MCA0968397.1 alpha/beta hydrolase [Priestia flexa]RIV09988.1 alpha/beta hydrolase [Priestia flexa]UIR28454.1 alpha/beta hydrolase [Priestia flexa]
MKHIFKQGINSKKPVLLMLHGTGGTEEDLLPIAEMIDPEASVLSVRGSVLEQGMPRFFKRLREGVFDIEDLAVRTKELNNFLDEAAEEYAFDGKNIIAIGYSNGANIAGSLLFHYEQSLKGAVLFHPMVPRRDIKVPNAQGIPIFIGAGVNDPICPADETKELTTLLQGAGATVDVHWESFGHQLTRTEVEAAKAWYRRTHESK